MKNTNTTEQIVTQKHTKNGITMRVNAKITGKPRLKLGVWLIKLGVWLSQVHVRVWIEEERRK